MPPNLLATQLPITHFTWGDDPLTGASKRSNNGLAGMYVLVN